METLLELHPLATPKRAGELTRVVEALVKERRRVVVWVADEGRRQILDDFLWTYSKLSFLPHRVWTAELGEVEDPVVLVGEPANPNRAEVLVVADELPPAEWAATFDAVHDFIPPGEEGEARSSWWQQWRDGGGGAVDGGGA